MESASASTALALALAGVSTVVLAALHLAAPRIRRLPLVPERATGSFAGGLAVAYVFLHLLPEVARGNQELREVFAEGDAEPSALLELGIFVVALLGFLVFYSLERLAERSAKGSGDERSNSRVFWLHLGSFLLYNAVITYTLPSTYRTDVFYALLFTVAMGLHFVLTDRGLEEHYGDQFDRLRPRLMLAGALLAGWGLAGLLAPTRAVTVTVLMAFLGGGILLNVFKEEIPSGGRSSLRWFTVGLVFYGVLLTGVTALEGGAGSGGEETARAAVARG